MVLCAVSFSWRVSKIFRCFQHDDWLHGRMCLFSAAGDQPSRSHTLSQLNPVNKCQCFSRIRFDVILLIMLGPHKRYLPLNYNTYKRSVCISCFRHVCCMLSTSHQFINQINTKWTVRIVNFFYYEVQFSQFFCTFIFIVLQLKFRWNLDRTKAVNFSFSQKTPCLCNFIRRRYSEDVCSPKSVSTI
jgi:hypothetical protein